MGLKRSDVFKSNYVAQADLPAPINKSTDGEPVQVVIAHADIEVINGDNGKEDKAVISFKGDRLKPMILNSGNWTTIEDAYGDDSDSWIGKPILLYVDPRVMFGKERVGGVRVRIPSSGPASSAPTNGDVSPPAKTEATFGPAWADGLEKKVEALTAAEPASTLDALRAHVKAMNDGVPPAVIDGSVMNWPRSVMPACQEWLTDKSVRDLPF